MDRNIKVFITLIKGDRQLLKFYAIRDTALEGHRQLQRILAEQAKAIEALPAVSRYELLPNTVCLVNSKIRHQWCRARIEPVDIGAQVLVTLIDYGDLEGVSIADIRRADVQMARYQPYAFECILADVIPVGSALEWSPQAIALCERNLLRQTLSGYIVSEYNRIPVVRLAKVGVSEPFVQRLIDEDLAEIHVFETPGKVGTYPGPKYKYVRLEVNTTHLVTISSISGPQSFCVQLTPAEVELKNLMDHIELCASKENLQPVTVPAIDMPCLAVVDKGVRRHYRAVINDVKQNICRITLVDYGDVVAKDYRELKTLPPQFLSLRAQAIKCSLQDSSVIDSEMFKRLAQKYRDFTCQVVGTSGDCYIVVLSCNGRDLQSLMRNALQLPRPCYTQHPLRAGMVVDVTLITLNDPCHFYCQAVAHKEHLEAVTHLVHAAGSFQQPSFEDLFPGCPVCAKFSEDEQWYRSKVMTLSSPNNIEVFFVDYGNSEKVSIKDIRSITPELLKYPVQAYRFSLHDFAPTDDVKSNSVIEWFESCTADKNLKAEVKSLNETGYNVVLSAEGCAESINSILRRKMSKVVGTFPSLQSTEVLYVTYTDTESFYGQLSRFSQDALSELQEEMNGFYSHAKGGNINPSEGDLVCAKFSEDQQFYRALVESVSSNSCCVFFVDYGNRENVPLKDIHPIQLQFAKHPYFGIECIPDANTCKVSVEKLTSVILEKEVEVNIMNEISPGKLAVSFTQNFPGNAGIWNLVKQTSAKGGLDSANDSYKDMRERTMQKPFVQRSGRYEHLDNNENFVGQETVDTAAQQINDANSNCLCDYDQIVIPDESLKEVFVCYVKSPSEFYCQITKDSSKLLTLMSSLQEVYNATRPDVLRIDSIRMGMPCSARFEEDGMWYRAKIKSVAGRSCEVIFVDYGNTQDIDSSELKVLKSSFFSLPPQALRCALFNTVPEGGQWNRESIDAFTRMSLDKSFIAQFVKTDDDGTYQVNLLNINKVQEDVLNKEFVSLGHGHLEDSSKVLVVDSLVASTSFEFPEIDVPLGSTEDIKVTFITYSWRVFCQLVCHRKTFHAMMESIQDHYNSSASNSRAIVDRPTVGMICVAQYSEDQAWYRAKVLDVEKHTVSVFYVDYGNSEIIEKKSMRYILQEFTAMPCQAIECRMQGVFNSSISITESVAKLFEGDLQCTFTSKDKGVYTVELTNEGRNIADEIAKTHVGVKPEDASVSDTDVTVPKISPFDVASFQKDQLLGVTISYIESPLKFWCQLADQSSQLDEMLHILAEAFSSTPCTENSSSFPDGSSCIAKFSEDGECYRAMVKSTTSENKKEVFFVDYGNSDIVNLTEIRKISEDLVKLPAQAFQCCLYNAPKVISEEATTKFEELVDTGEEVTAKIEGVSAGIVLASLFVESEPEVEISISEALFGAVAEQPLETVSSFPPLQVPSGEHKGVVCHVVNPGDFHINLEESEPLLQNIIAELSAKYGSAGENDFVLHNAVEGAVCCAKFSEDDAWYRAQITKIEGEDCTVCFVDYGNFDTVSKNSLKCLEENLLSIPPQGIPCKLAAVQPKNGVWDDAAVDVMSSLIDEEESLCISILQQEVPAPVVIKRGGRTIQDELVELGLAELVQSNQAVPTAPLVAPTYSKVCYPERTVEKSKVSAKISFVHAYNNFFITTTDWEEQLEAVAESLSEASFGEESLLDSSELQCNLPCAAKYSEDGLWYRALITGVSGADISVLFVDYGNKETVHVTDLKKLDPSHLQYPPLAVECRLDEASVESDEAEIMDKLQTMCDEATSIDVEIVDNGKPSVVRIPDLLGEVERQAESITGPAREQDEKEFGTICAQESEVANIITGPAVDVTEQDEEEFGMVCAQESEVTSAPDAEGHVYYLPRQVQTGVKMSVSCSYVSSWNRFFISADDWAEDFEKIKGQIYYSDFSNSRGIPVENLYVGCPCIVKYSEDEAWYRASVKEVEGEDVAVSFVDYGNEEIVKSSEIRELEAELLKLPPFSVECTLHGIKASEGREDEIETKLQELVDLGTRVDVEIVSKEKPYPVRLFSLAEDLMKEGLILSNLEPEKPVQDFEAGEPQDEEMKDLEVPVEKSYENEEAFDDSFEMAEVKDSEVPVEKSYKNEVTFGDSLEVAEAKDSEVPVEKSYENEVTFGDSLEVAEAKDSEVPVEKSYENEVTFGDSLEVAEAKDSEVPVEKSYENEVTFGDSLEVAEAKDSEVPVEKSYENEVTFGDSLEVAEAKDSEVPVEKSYENEVTFGDSFEVAGEQNVEQSAADEHMESHGYDIHNYPARVFETGFKMVCLLTHVESWDEFYVMAVDWNEEFEFLKEAIKTATSSEIPVLLENIQIGQACLVKCPDDGTWHRAVISDIDECNIFSKYVDSGRTELVAPGDCYHLPNKLLKFPQFAVSCTLDSLELVTAKQAIQVGLQSLLDEVVQLELEVTEVSEPLHVKILSSHSILDQLTGKTFGLSGELADEAFTESVEADEDDDDGKLPVEDVDEVVNQDPTDKSFPERKILPSTLSGEICSVHSWNKFFVTAVDWSGDKLNVEALLQSYDGDISFNIEPLGILENQPCIAKVTTDRESWVRAVVAGIDGDSVSLHLVDSGALATVEKSALKKALPACLMIPPLAVECQISELDPIEIEQQHIFNQLNDLCVSRTNVMINFKSEHPPYHVRVMVDGIDFMSHSSVSASPVEKETCEWLQDPQAFKGNLKIAFVDEQKSLEFRPSIPLPPQRFGDIVGDPKHIQATGPLVLYIVPSDLEDSLAQVQLELQNVYDEPMECLTSIEDGMYCVAKFPEDNSWYRAQILQHNEDSVLVKSVDYGSTEIIPVSELRELLPKFLMLPQFAFECCLSGAMAIEGCEEAIQSKLMEYESEYRIQLCDIPCHSSKNCYCIRGINVAGDDIMEMLVNEYLVRMVCPHFHDFTEFDASELVFEDDRHFFVFNLNLQEKRTVMQEALRSTYGEITSGSIPEVMHNRLYAANISSEWRRVSVKNVKDSNTVEIACVDYGTVHEVPSSSIHILDPEFCHTSAFMLKCFVPGLFFSTNDRKQKFSELLQQGPLKCVIICFDTQASAYKIHVSLNGKDLYSLFSEEMNCEEQSAGQTAAEGRLTTSVIDDHDKNSSDMDLEEEEIKSRSSSEEEGFFSECHLDECSEAVTSAKQDSVECDNAQSGDIDKDHVTEECSPGKQETEQFDQQPDASGLISIASDAGALCTTKEELCSVGEKEAPVVEEPRNLVGQDAEKDTSIRDEELVHQDDSITSFENKLQLISQYFYKNTPEGRSEKFTGEIDVTVTDVLIEQCSSLFLYVVPVQWRSGLEDLEKSLQTYCCDSDIQLPQPVSGLCAAKSGDCWRRGIILNASKDTARVLFVDHGYEDEVDMQNIRELSPDFLKHKPFSVLCSLPHVKCFEQSVRDDLADCVCQKNVTISVLNESWPYEVKLMDDNGVVQQLISENSLILQISSHSVAPGRYLARVSFVNSDSKSGLSVHIQMVDRLSDMAELMSKMQCIYENKIGRFSAEEAVNTGLYAVEHNSMWKRCTVLKNDDVVLLYLVDEGDYFDASGLLLEPLLFEFSLQRPFAVPCYVSDLPPDVSESHALRCLEEAASSNLELYATFSEKPQDGFHVVSLTSKEGTNSVWNL